MKILLIMDPGIPVPPIGYGGIERIVALLAIEYLRLGHQVEVLASKGSYIDGCVMHVIGPDGFPPGKKVMNKAVLTAWRFIWKRRNDFDLIHNFGRLLYLLPVLSHSVNKIMCYQREITSNNITFYARLPKRNIFYCGCSTDLIKRANPPGNWHAIHNAVDFDQFELVNSVANDAPLIFLGRIERVKGCHTAIKVALTINRKLIIAGNISKLPEEITYFENEIKPYIDNERIIYAGEVDDKQKKELLQKSQALLMPIEWDEPFGIVMIEAMACGTPVVGYHKGAITEVIDEGVTGYLVEDYKKMLDRCQHLNDIDRASCRSCAAKRFDIKVIAEKYLSII